MEVPIIAHDYKEVRRMSIESIKNVGNSYSVDSSIGRSMAHSKVVQQSSEPVHQVETKPIQQPPQNLSITENAVNANQREIANDQVKKAVSDLNKRMSETSCQFGIHEGTNRVTIKIVDKVTKEVIKEFPAEETLEMIEKAWELAGIMVDEKL